MSIVAQSEAAAGRSTDTRISSYLLAEYLERLGVEVIFGLCGHTNIAFLDAVSKSRIRFITARHEQVAAHAADGYARASGKTGVLLTHLGPGLTNATTGVWATSVRVSRGLSHRLERAGCRRVRASESRPRRQCASCLTSACLAA